MEDGGRGEESESRGLLRQDSARPPGIKSTRRTDRSRACAAKGAGVQYGAMKPTRILPALLAAALLAGGCIHGAPNVSLIEWKSVNQDVHARIAAMPPAAEKTFALASPFSDHMVLQRDCPIPVWGTGTPGETVELTLFVENGEVHRALDFAVATVGENGRWAAVLAHQSAGGPFTLSALEYSEDTPDVARLTLSDILIGDVWLCGG